MHFGFLPLKEADNVHVGTIALLNSLATICQSRRYRRLEKLATFAVSGLPFLKFVPKRRSPSEETGWMITARRVVNLPVTRHNFGSFYRRPVSRFQ
jgi:hypothetical protein